MNCPNCGIETVPDQQYCRSCGADLAGDERRPFNPQSWGLFVLMLIFGGLLIAMGGKLWAVKWMIFTGLFIMLGGVFCVAAYGLLRQTRRRKSKPKAIPPADRQPQVLRADTTNKLLPIPDNDFIPSVVDDTTELLRTPAVHGTTD